MKVNVINMFHILQNVIRKISRLNRKIHEDILSKKYKTLKISENIES